MKIRTKFLAAVLATATAFSCALTASALNPEPRITLDNTTMPATLQGNTATATLTLTSTNFGDVRGAKITIQFPMGVTLERAKITGSDWVADQDYKVDTANGRITLVDVFNIDSTTKTDLSLNLEVTVSNVTTWDNIGNITVSGEFADSKVDQVIKLDSCGTGTLVIGREETSASSLNELNNSINAEDYFIPYGGAYIGDYNLPKDNNGTFQYDGTVTGNIGVLKCKMPADGKVTTFGASESLVGNANTSIQFGSYINKITAENGTFGTLLIVSRTLPNTLTDSNYTKGTYENAVKCFNGDVEALLNNIIAKFKSEWFDGKLHPYTYGTTKEVVYAAVVPQKTYMWRDKEENREKLQYAVRCTGLDNDEKRAYVYTAVGYSLKDTTYAFSTEVQSASYNSLNPVNNQ